MDKLLNQLVAPVSVSGCEGAVSAVIAELAKPYGDISTDHLGNLVVHKKGTGRRILAAAHMDTIGIIVTYVDENGFVRFGNLGGLKLAAVIGQRVRFADGTVGVICFEGGTEFKELSWDKLYIDTAGAPVRVGDTAVFCCEPVYTGDKVIASYLDNRLGCAVLLKAMEYLGETDNEIFWTFTVQEEVGCRGAKPVAYTICPDMAIAVDICGIQDYPGDKVNALTLEGGPVVKLMDRSVICHPQVVSLLEKTAEKLEMPVQRYVTKQGGTDAGAMFNTRGGVPSGVLSMPIRYTHCPNEIADMKTADLCARLLAAAVAE